MANVKISQLPGATAVTDTDLLPIVDTATATTQQATAQQFLNYVTSSTFVDLEVTSLTGSSVTGSDARFTNLTASNVQIISLDVDTITAREYYTEVVSASLIYESGSTKFGNSLDDTHQITGSLLLTGSLHQVTGTLDISGTLLATAKSFDIAHPTKNGMRLRYGSWEGPTNSVMISGMTTKTTVELPDYWTGLVHEDSITATLTPFGCDQHIWVEDIKENKIFIGGNLTKCSYLVIAERKDIPKLVVEY
jgi:hypothetical protein